VGGSRRQQGRVFTIDIFIKSVFIEALDRTGQDRTGQGQIFTGCPKIAIFVSRKNTFNVGSFREKFNRGGRT